LAVAMTTISALARMCSSLSISIHESPSRDSRFTSQWPRQITLSCAKHAFTSAAGFIHPASACHRSASPYLRDITPLGCQSRPSTSKREASRCVNCTPTAQICEVKLLSAETYGANKPTGKPEAPLAGLAAASTTVTCQPRLAKLCAAHAPAMPAPITTQCAMPLTIVV
jgi:hypothetical protein